MFSHFGYAEHARKRPNLPRLDHHRRSALVADDVGGLALDLEVGHDLLRALQILLELLVEFLEQALVVGLALLDLVELVLELPRVADVEDVVEARAEQLLDEDDAKLASA